MVKPKARQGEQNVPILFKRGEQYFSLPLFTYKTELSKQKLSKQDNLNPRSLAKVEWACSNIHMPIIRQGRITKEEDVRRPASYQEEEHPMHS